MKLLLDTHVLLWILGTPEKIRPAVRTALGEDNNEVFVSVVSLWEVVIKRRTGKLDADLDDLLASLAPNSQLQLLPLLPRHLQSLEMLQIHHRDPFDHLLMAQAIEEGMMFVSADDRVPAYPVRLMRA